MAAGELSDKYFSRDRVKNRMLKQAAGLWGYPETEIDNFDPLVSLLIEACSVEFEKMAGEISKTQNRMLERLAALLYPGMSTIRPASCILQARSSEPNSILPPDAQFVYKEFFFSPAKAVDLADAGMPLLSTARELFKEEEKLQRSAIARSAKTNPALQHRLWIGLDIAEDAALPERMPFFFSWTNQPGSWDWYQYLPYTHWSLPIGPLQHVAGLLPADGNKEPASRLTEEFDAMAKIEEETCMLYRHHFITILSNYTPQELGKCRCPYPPAFESLFDKKDLRELKQPLLWIEILFPSSIPLEALDTLACHINCFPALNRKLNKLTYKLLQSLNIVPLDSATGFLSIKQIINSRGDQVRLIPFSNPAGLPPETYTLRYGVNRFDKRNAQETLVNLVELIREESSFFSSMGHDFLTQNIRELNQILARLEEKVKVQDRQQSPAPFLIVRPEKEGGNIGIEYWSCNGEAANRITMGSGLSPYKESNTRTGSLVFMTATMGGRDHSSESEKIAHYKNALLTRDRIVTMEDLRSVVMAELGKSAQRVDVERTYVRSTRPAEGFMRCIKVTITPENNILGTEEWEYRLRALRLKLEERSANHLPYHISLTQLPATIGL